MQGRQHGHLHGESTPLPHEGHSAVHILVSQTDFKGVQLQGGPHGHLHEGHCGGPPHDESAPLPQEGHSIPLPQEGNSAVHILLSQSRS